MRTIIFILALNSIVMSRILIANKAKIEETSTPQIKFYSDSHWGNPWTNDCRRDETFLSHQITNEIVVGECAPISRDGSSCPNPPNGVTATPMTDGEDDSGNSVCDLRCKASYECPEGASCFNVDDFGLCLYQKSGSGPSPQPSPKPSPPPSHGIFYENPYQQNPEKPTCRLNEHLMESKTAQGNTAAACFPITADDYCPPAPKNYTAKPQPLFQDNQGNSHCALICDG